MEDRKFDPFIQGWLLTSCPGSGKLHLEAQRASCSHYRKMVPNILLKIRPGLAEPSSIPLSLTACPCSRRPKEDHLWQVFLSQASS